MAKKTMAVTLSCAVILIGIISIAVHGGLRYGIDFAGGTLVQLKFKNPPAIEEVRDGLRTIGLGESTIQEFGSKNHLLVRVERSEGKLEEIGTKIKNSLIGKYEAENIVVERVEMVGPKVGKDLREKAILSIVYAIIGIVIYISWRFEFQYAVAAIIALIHDVLVTMGAFSLADKEFTSEPRLRLFLPNKEYVNIVRNKLLFLQTSRLSLAEEECDGGIPGIYFHE